MTTDQASAHRSSWDVKGEDVASELSHLMNVGSDESALLSALEEEAEEAAQEMSEAFYDRLFDHAKTREFLEGQDMDRLHGMIRTWFTELFSGDYGPDYVANRLHIGTVHVQIGLPVRYPLAMIDVVQAYGQRVTSSADDPEAAADAFRKVLALDVAIFNQAYEDNQLQHLADLVGGKRLARRLLMGQG